MDDLILKIKNSNIIDIISNYLTIKKINQKQFKGNCPFHKDKTPSFFVDIDGYYKCFGCGKGGDIINFVQEIEQISFQDAIDKICKILGIEKQNKVLSYVKNNTTDLYIKNKQLAEFFQKKLFLKENQDILNYLIKIRKLNIDIIKKFQIGYCESDVAEIIQTLDISRDDLIKLSIVKKGEFNDRLFFLNRIIIPIFDKKNNIISFGGRVYQEENTGNFKSIKYLNGANNEIFHKSSILFNINNVLQRKTVKEATKKTTEENNLENALIVVEGYMDAITLEKNNIKSLASLGTSLSVKQLELLFSIDKCPYFCYDSDNAGQMATFNICKKILELIQTGINPRFISLQGCKDLDEFFNKFNKQDFYELLLNSKEYIDYIFDFFIKDFDVNNPSDKSIFQVKIENFLKEIKDKILYKNYIQYIKNKLYLKSVNKKNFQKNKIKNLNLKCKKIYLEKLASFLLQYPSFIHKEEIFQFLNQDNIDDDVQLILDIINDNLSEVIKGKIQKKYIFHGDSDRIFISILDAIRLDDIKNQEDAKNKKIIRKNILLKKFAIDEEEDK